MGGGQPRVEYLSETEISSESVRIMLNTVYSSHSTTAFLLEVLVISYAEMNIESFQVEGIMIIIICQK